jgi:hypothetical protein
MSRGGARERAPARARGQGVGRTRLDASPKCNDHVQRSCATIAVRLPVIEYLTLSRSLFGPHFATLTPPKIAMGAEKT